VDREAALIRRSTRINYPNNKLGGYGESCGTNKKTNLEISGESFETLLSTPG
jgi:hypothetical protein